MSYSMIIVLVFCIGSVLSQNACETKRLKDSKAGGGWRGTNVGSWFVLENWMASYLWNTTGCNKDKYPGSFLWEKCLGPAKAKEVMDKHWATWITEADFESMSKNGINVVRVPVGWWNIYDPQGGVQNAKLNYKLPDAQYVVGGLAYLDKAFDWGQKHGVGIILDLHGAPGSQNGNDNSSPYEFQVRHFFTNPDNPKQAAESLGLYAERYADKEALIGFDVINEPGGWSGVNQTELTVIQDFYKLAYTAIRKYSKDSWVLLMPLNGQSGYEDTWNKFMNKDQGYTNVGMDLHYYSCFEGPGDKKNANDAIAYINKEVHDIIAQYNKVNTKPQMIGEWSACMHGDKARFGDFFKAQLDVYNTTKLGQTFWSWTDQGIDSEQPSGYCPGNAWSMKVAIKEGWIGKLSTAC